MQPASRIAALVNLVLGLVIAGLPFLTKNEPFWTGPGFLQHVGEFMIFMLGVYTLSIAKQEFRDAADQDRHSRFELEDHAYTPSVNDRLRKRATR